jgi:ElaB/YqjD/DUF883 family membrane-anchored ribosome-binding protein
MNVGNSRRRNFRMQSDKSFKSYRMPPEPTDFSNITPPNGEPAPTPLSSATQRVVETAQQASQTVQQTAQDLSAMARAKSAHFVENQKARMNRHPTEALLEALIIGFFIGLLIRLLERPRDKKPSKVDVNHRPTLEETKFHLGSIFLPFLWPLWTGARKQYERSAEGVQTGLQKVRETDYRKIGKQSVEKAEDWLDEEVTPVAKASWKKARQFWS